MPNLQDHEQRIRALEARLHEQDGVVKMLRIIATMLGIAVAIITLGKVTG